MTIRIGVPKEVTSGETRVALIPSEIKKLRKKGFQVIVQSQAGAASGINDSAYQDAGAELVHDSREVYRQAKIVVKVQRPVLYTESRHIRNDSVIISVMQDFRRTEDLRLLAETKATFLGLDHIPRTTRAQTMDALSSQNNLAGYKAVILGAHYLGKLMPMMMTAAGTMAPSRVLVIGAGVAGLQAIATAKRLGAVVAAFDTRSAVADQVKSLGAKFVEVPMSAEDMTHAETESGYAGKLSSDYYELQKSAIHEHVCAADIIVSTAQIFGQRAPILISKETVQACADGTVIVDLAVETGGNCELTMYDQVTTVFGVTIVGLANLPAQIPAHASQLYSRNVYEFIDNLIDSRHQINLEDEITASSLICRDGTIVKESTKKLAAILGDSRLSKDNHASDCLMKR